MTGGDNSKGPLAGRRIVVTRTRQQAGTLSDGLRELGAEVIELPTIEIVPPDSWEPLDHELQSLASYEWLVVTSGNAVRAIGERLAVLGIDLAALSLVRIAAVGPSTAAALEVLGAVAALIPPMYVAESLAEAMRDKVTAGSRVLLVRAAIARDVIPEALAALGARVDVIDAYRTIVPDGAAETARAVFCSGGRLGDEGGLGQEGFARDQTPPDAVTFTSSSTVKHFLALLAEAGIARPAGLRAISIGPITSATLRENGWEPTAEALRHDVPGLIAATVGSFVGVS